MTRIDDNYVIFMDGYNYVLKRDTHRTAKVKDNDEEQPVYVTIGYYGNFKAALERMLQEDIREKLAEGTRSLKEAVELVKERHEYWEKLVKRATCDE